MVKILIETPVNKTELKEQIVKAIRNIFPDVECLEDKQDKVIYISSDITMFGKLLEQQRIRDTARKIILKNMKDNISTFYISKQVATVGKINFVEHQNPLGDFFIKIEDENLINIIDKIAPSTLNFKH